MRMTISRSSRLAVLAAVACLAPATARGQEVAQQAGTHVVRTGDTLWDLARRYFADPFLWPEIYRVNTDVIEDPHWIYPGETLRIPAGMGQAVAFGPEDTPVPRPSTMSYPTGATVFQPQERGTARLGGPAVDEPRTVVRSGEFYAAPFVEREGGPRGTGRLVGTSDISGITHPIGDKYLYQDRIYLVPPSQSIPAVGDRYLTFRPGPILRNMGQVMIPTGIVQVHATHNGDAVSARIVQQFDEVRLGDRVMELEPFDLEPGIRPEPVELGISSRVVWIQEEPLQPTLLRYVVVNATNRDGIRVGDQFTLLRGRTRTPDGVNLPEERIAVVQAVRVTPFGVTAIVIDHTQPAIREGTTARVTARMP